MSSTTEYNLVTNVTEDMFKESLSGYYYFYWPYATSFVSGTTYYESGTENIFIPVNAKNEEKLSNDTYYTKNDDSVFEKTKDKTASNSDTYYVSLKYKAADVTNKSFSNNYVHQSYIPAKQEDNNAVPAKYYEISIYENKDSKLNLVSESEVRSGYNAHDLLISPNITYNNSSKAYTNILDCKEAYMKLMYKFGYTENSVDTLTTTGTLTMNNLHTKCSNYSTSLINNLCNNIFRSYTLNPNAEKLSEDRNITDSLSLLKLDYTALNLNNCAPGIIDILNFNLNTIDTEYVSSFINELAEITVTQIEKWHNDYINNIKSSIENDWKSIKETLTGMVTFQDVYEKVDTSKGIQERYRILYNRR